MNQFFIVEIDPREKSVKKVEFSNEVVGLEDLYASLECDMVERISINEELDLWIDEEGRLNGADDRIGMFNIGEYQFVGKGLICMFDFEEGESLPMSEELSNFLLENLNVQF